MTQTVMVRLPKDHHAKLMELAAADQVSLTEKVRRLIEAAWRQHILDETNRRYAELRADPEAWAEEEAERELWDTTLLDGLRQEPAYPPNDEGR